MENHKRITGLLVYLLVVLVIIAGMVIPKILIEEQQGRIFGNTHIIKIQEKESMFSRKETTTIEITQTELIERLAAWSKARGTYFSREPYQNELSMDAAFSIAKIEMQKLIEMSAVPYIDIQKYRLDSAELWANSEGVARWTLKISHDEKPMTLELDAMTGKIYIISFSFYQGDSTLNFDSTTRLFAEYHEIESVEQSYYSDAGMHILTTEKSTEKSTEKFMIYVKSFSSSTDNSNLSIILDIAH
ncbi:hypothetical protein GC105_00625 [Alkalibaculum sp. M08DMB]|uniref:Uncharacterized protein n=1 Tax=Alkalibaculum sporogenes TaxID=2655001 RepID=A0A6A7K4I4_9FIRM|nr:hypothetical protein [Alkalibaculum sporogenes]MPW24298.1 hypothetical protein [Alkalibaculum sporogenes]